jgi:class 3 adenylate cyclase
MAMRGRQSAELAPYVPRVAVDWAKSTPDQTWREFDGSLVFVDISGFTALSERLAKRGRQGAEELTETLSRCFADLLAVGYAAGGSLLKFGGDALLLLFDGAEHETRATASALRMRAVLRDVGRVTTSVGSFRLRMSVGVHSGRLHLFRVGDSHRELFVTGPGASATVTMEGTADAGEVVVSPATAAALDPRWVGAPKGAGFLLRNPTLPAEPAVFPPAPRPSVDISAGIPVALREHLGARVEAEHRQVTIAFVHFDEIDALIESQGAAAAAAALDQLTRDAQAAAEAHGVTFLGSDVDHDGGKIILVAGAPLALGDDDGRMLRALRAIADGDRVLPTRFGVNRGHVFVGEVGPPYRRTYTVMGDTVNLAARLMAKASPGQILSTAMVLNQADTLYETTALPPFTVKGKSKPIDAFAVGSRIGRRRGVADQLDQLPFIGRDAELGALVRALDDARIDRGGLVEITGEAGIGKSRLVSELRRRAEGFDTFTSYCEIYEEKTPYFAFRYLLRGALGIARGTEDRATALRSAVAAAAPALLPWLPLIAEVADIEVAPTKETDALDPEFRPERTRWAVIELLGAVVRQPTLFIIEDGEWMDALSATLLADAVRQAPTRPWLFCLIHRIDTEGVRLEDELPRLRIDLAPLDDPAAASLVTAGARDVLLRPHERDALVRQAGGNPLFLEELLRSYDAEAGGDLPESLEGLVAAQIDRLPADDRRLLRYAAVLGPIFETSQLARLVDAGDGRKAAVAVRRLRTFLEPFGANSLRFRNQCYRAVAYESLPFMRRRELHDRAGESIEQSLGADAAERAETLSLHFLHAQRYDKCWHYARLGAERAKAKYANLEAAELYERALAAGGHLGDDVRPEVAATWQELGDACLKAGVFDRARRAFTRARKLLAGDHLALASLCRLESLTALHEARLPSASRWITRGLRYLEALEPDQRVLAARAELRYMRAQSLQRAGKNRDAVPWCVYAIDDALAAGNEGALAHAYTALDLAALGLGRVDELTHLPLALEIWERLDRLKEQAAVLTILGVTAYFQGKWDDALSYFDRGRDAYLRAGDVVNAGYPALNVTDILIDQGRAQEAEQGLHELLELWRSVRYPEGVAGALLNLGRCALQSGDYGDALTLFEEAKQNSLALGEAAGIEADAWLAECLIHNREPEAALDLIDAALRRDASSGGTLFSAKLHRLRGYAQAALNNLEDATAELCQSLDVARARESLYEIALALEGLASVRRLSGEPADPADDAEWADLIGRLGVRDTHAPRLDVLATSRSS